MAPLGFISLSPILQNRISFDDVQKARLLRDAIRRCTCNFVPSVFSSLNEQTLICAYAMKLKPFLSAVGYTVPIKNGEMLVITNKKMVEVGGLSRAPAVSMLVGFLSADHLGTFGGILCVQRRGKHWTLLFVPFACTLRTGVQVPIKRRLMCVSEEQPLFLRFVEKRKKGTGYADVCAWSAWEEQLARPETHAAAVQKLKEKNKEGRQSEEALLRLFRNEVVWESAQLDPNQFVGQQPANAQVAAGLAAGVAAANLNAPENIIGAADF